MGEDHSRRIEFQGTPNDNPRINASCVYGAPEEPLKGYQPLLAVPEHTTEVLVLLLGELQLAELLYVRGLGEAPGVSYPGFQDVYGLPDGSLLCVSRP